VHHQRQDLGAQQLPSEADAIIDRQRTAIGLLTQRYEQLVSEHSRLLAAAALPTATHDACDTAIDATAAQHAAVLGADTKGMEQSTEGVWTLDRLAGASANSMLFFLQ